MPFKCFSCGLSFDTAEKFTEHSLAHKMQLDNPEKRGLVCPKCGKPIPIDSSEADYTGSIVCPGCEQTVKVAWV